MVRGTETIARVVAVLVFATAWIAGAVGAVRAGHHRPGRSYGLARSLRANGTYLLVAAPYLAVCIALWHPLPVTPGPIVRWLALLTAVVVGGAGAVSYLWGRATLGAMYNVSSALGCELFVDHRLVTTGPYRFVRHPMYVGLVLAAVGALALFRVWTFVFVIAALTGAVLKAHHEDRLLAEEFGPEFEQYRAMVPGWFPHRRHRPV